MRECNATHLLRGLVEGLALHGELVGPVDEVVKLLAALEDGLDRFVLVIL